MFTTLGNTCSTVITVASRRGSASTSVPPARSDAGAAAASVAAASSAKFRREVSEFISMRNTTSHRAFRRAVAGKTGEILTPEAGLWQAGVATEGGLASPFGGAEPRRRTGKLSSPHHPAVESPLP